MRKRGNEKEREREKEKERDREEGRESVCVNLRPEHKIETPQKK